MAGLKLPLEWKIRNAEDFEKPFLTADAATDKGTVLFPKLEDDKNAPVKG